VGALLDYGRPVQFGLFPTPEAEALEEILSLARIADDAGLELIGIQDHPYQRRFLDTWMLMATVLAETQRVRVFPDVANLPLRPPAVMAKAAASLDVLSGGRFELGLGGRWLLDGNRGDGWALTNAGRGGGCLGGGDQGHPVDLVGRAVGPVRRSALPLGRCEARSAPGPRHGDLARRRRQTHPRPRRPSGGRMVPSSGWATPDKLADMHARIDEAAVTAGRDPGQIRRVYNVWGLIDGPGGFLNGSAGQWVDELTELAVYHGMDTFVFGPSADPVPQSQRFANEIAPVVGQQVAQQRGG
jgi:hypothetical protein